MSNLEPHPTDEGKFQSAVDSYGHGVGNGKSRSAIYKHLKSKGRKSETSSVDGGSTPPPPLESDAGLHSPDDPPSQPSWLDWEPETSDATESLPAPLKVIATTRRTQGAMSPADLETMREQSRAILTLGLVAADSGMTAYARAVTEDADYLISHSDAERYLVADAQARWLESRGFMVSDVVGTGTIAAALTAGYIVPPLYKARSKAKKSIIGPRAKSRMARIVRKIPFIGKRLVKAPQYHDFGKKPRDPNFSGREVESDEVE